MSSDGSMHEEDSHLPFALGNRKESRRVPLGKLVEMRAKGQLKPAAAQIKRESEAAAPESRSVKKHKKSKNGAPAILSTKVPLSRKRVVLPETVHKPRDPRFDGVSGAVDLGLVQHAYGFVDEARAQELKQLEETLKLTQEQEARDEIVDRIHLLRDQERVLNQKKQAHELAVRVKARERTLGQEAGRPVRLNKKKKRELEMSERFKMLEERGEVDKFLKGKRKKLQQRNKKLIPVSKK